MVAYSSARKIKDYIVKYKLHPPKINLQREGCKGCGNSRCQVCKSLMVTDKYDSFTTKMTKTTL